MKRVVICWSRISGYMASCWRALLARPELEILVVAFQPGADTVSPYDQGIMEGIPHKLVPLEKEHDYEHMVGIIKGHKPDVVVVPGWAHAVYLKMPWDEGLRRAKFVMAVDTPWDGTVRQRLARWKLGRYVDRMDAAVVAGERAWQRVRHLGMPERKIFRGVYGVDCPNLAKSYERRAAGAWPKRFLFTGRYEHVKAIDVLVEGYRRYRGMVSDPWPLACCGRGELGKLMAGVEGMQDLGFRQPPEMPKIYAEHGVFVLASRFDPWPLVVVEAAAAGMPVVCTEACGSNVELVRPCYNGLTVATEDAGALARGMAWMHHHYEELPEMGRRGMALAAAYSPEAWAARWERMFGVVTGGGSGLEEGG